MARQRAGLQLLMRVAGRSHAWLYRATGGRLGSNLGVMPVLLLTTTWPLGYLTDGDRLVVIASAGGQPQHPAWYLNLRANRRVTVQRGGETVAMVATPAESEERARLWERIIRDYPQFAGYQRKTGREIPVVLLRRAVSADEQASMIG
jgi:F420H(2)-dependent quinone reductase